MVSLIPSTNRDAVNRIPVVRRDWINIYGDQLILAISNILHSQGPDIDKVLLTNNFRHIWRQTGFVSTGVRYKGYAAEQQSKADSLHDEFSQSHTSSMLAPLRLLWIMNLSLRSRFHQKLTLVPVFIVLIFCALGSLQAEQANPTRWVGTDDLREGYEHKSFITRTRRLGALIAVPADLEKLSRKPPLGLEPPSQIPRQQVIALGRRLFFDRRLSANNTLSCGMCHIPEQAFTQNELATPVGIEGAVVIRNAPSLYNVGYRDVLFHDGRETNLERQIWAPLLAANEMGNPDKSSVLTRIAADDHYQNAFREAFPDGLTEQTLGTALAAYQRALGK